MLYPHPRGPPFKPALRVLTERLLGRRIQQGSHDSVADAVATMELAMLKFQKGPAFGEQRQQGEPLVDILSTASRRSSLVDRSRTLTRLTTGSASAVAATGDADAAAKGAREARSRAADFVWVGLMDLSILLENRAAARRAVDGAPPADGAAAESGLDSGVAAAAARPRAAPPARDSACFCCLHPSDHNPQPWAGGASSSRGGCCCGRHLRRSASGCVDHRRNWARRHRDGTRAAGTSWV